MTESCELDIGTNSDWIILKDKTTKRMEKKPTSPSRARAHNIIFSRILQLL